MIKVSYLLSYDYQFFLTSVKELYHFVDKIVVAIDSDRKTWSGNDFEIPQSFFDEVQNFDSRKIIEFYFDSFYVPTLTPMECETRERNLVLKKLGKGWKIQLDVDEYIYDFAEVAKYLRKYWYFTLLPKITPICFRGKLITLFKKTDNGFVFIDNSERFPFITNQSYNIHTRRNDLIRNYNSNIAVIHQSWAREEEEILMKIKNWGHRDDFDTLAYVDFWKKLNENNYKETINFHPIKPEVWRKLDYLKSESIEEFVGKYARLNKQKLNPILFKTQLTALINKVFK